MASKRNEVTAVVRSDHGGAPRETVQVIGGDDSLTARVCEQLETAPWVVVRSDAATLASPAEHDDTVPVLTVVVARDCPSAETLVQRLLHGMPGLAVVVIAEEVTPEGVWALTAAGALVCVEAATLFRSPGALVVGCLLEMDQLRRRLRHLNDETLARHRLAERAQSALDETARALRATASGVLMSLQALRSGRHAVLSPGEATVVDSLCASVQSMFDLFDAIETSTPIRGLPTRGPRRAGRHRP